jgi:hypothetical protein
MFLDKVLDRLVNIFTSLRLTVVCLALALVLVFLGTMAQEPMGLYLAQDKFFRSFFVGAAPMWAAIKKTLQMLHIYLPPSTAADVLSGSRLPVFPGGYLVGGVLLLNLLATQLRRGTFAVSRLGLWLVHVGLGLLLIGQLLTDLLSRETTLHLREGETKNYSETQRESELAVIDATEPAADKVIAIPQAVLARQESVRPSGLPFVIQVKQFLANSRVQNRTANAALPPAATQDVGARATVQALPRVTDLNQRDVPSAVIEIQTAQGSLGTWLVSEFIEQAQSLTWSNRTYRLALRPRRYYKPYSIQLLKFQHDVYPGTEIPKNFASRVLLHRPGTGEKREVLIYMNNPLRYAGETYYQSGFDPDNRGTILQVVRNPSWLTPYFSCVLVGVGLIIQFGKHLLGFTFKRRAA